MTLNINLRKMVHRKALEQCTNLTANTAAGSFVVADKSDTVGDQNFAFYVGGVSSIWYYNADEDGWNQLPNSGLTGAFGAGSCGEFRGLACPAGNMTITASAGTTTTLSTSLTIVRNLAGCKLRVVGGPGSGYEGVIKSNTLGANSVITLETASGVAFTNATQFQLYSGSFWFWVGGTTSVGFGVYDRATNAWTTRSITGMPIAWGTDAQMISTPSARSNDGLGFVNGTATAGAAATLTTNKTFTVNQYANMQVRIVSGTGAGQVRTISSNTAGANSVLTVSSNWTTVPDATSVYRIEGNDDHIYLMGNNAVTLYRYSIAGNSWSTLAPTAARAGAMAAGGTADWIANNNNPDWTSETADAHYTTQLVKQLGRYIYSFRGNATSTLDVYDIALNTWYSNVLYGNQMETFTTGSCAISINGMIYLQKEATGRVFRFDVARHCIEPFTTLTVPQGAAVAGDKMFAMTFREGASELRWIYTLANTRAECYRLLII